MEGTLPEMGQKGAELDGGPPAYQTLVRFDIGRKSSQNFNLRGANYFSRVRC